VKLADIHDGFHIGGKSEDFGDVRKSNDEPYAFVAAQEESLFKAILCKRATLPLVLFGPISSYDGDIVDFEN
jgi:hypothetical protein